MSANHPPDDELPFDEFVVPLVPFATVRAVARLVELPPPPWDFEDES